VTGDRHQFVSGVAMLGKATHSALLEAVHSTARRQAGLGSPSRKVIAETVLRPRLAIGGDDVGQMFDDTPTAKLVRQVLGAISEFDKAMTVAKLRGARERKRREAGKCEGRKSHAERNPKLVALVKRLHRQRPKGGRMSLRAISAELATQGFLNENGRPFAAASIRSMIE
jgi:hypothetical protein